MREGTLTRTGVEQAAAAGQQGGQAAGMPLWREDTLHVRRGVAPGSFLDLLMRAKDRTTGRGFTDVELAAQVAPEPACTPGRSPYTRFGATP